MLSRTAEGLYWLGRYLERAENLARLADVNLQTTTEQVSADGTEAWDAVIATMGAQDAFEEAQAEHPGLTPADFVIYSMHYPQSLRSTIFRARSLAREIREYLSREVFEEINGLYLSTSRPPGEGSHRALYANVKRSVAAILGLFDNTVLLTEGREWFRVGMFLERADMTSRIIDTKYFILLPSPNDVGGPLDRYQWMAVLRSASALEAFRKHHHGTVTGPRVADLLMFERAFPRSLMFSLLAMKRHFERATEHTPDSRSVRAAREIALLELDLRAADSADVIRSGLHQFLDEFQLRLGRIDEALTEDIFRGLPEATTAGASA
ncbi:MAG: alpha-E domain-containing protein [Dehalococcoidia bacterium]|nr:alpha-E domain-containing protein [Dehalococcoidia bacterium]